VERGAPEDLARLLASGAEATRPSRVRGAVFIGVAVLCLVCAYGVVAYYQSQWNEAQEIANRSTATLIVRYDSSAVAGRAAVFVVGAVLALVKGLGIFADARKFARRANEAAD